MSVSDIELLQRKLERERAARKQAEQLLEQKSRELFQRNEALREEVQRRELTEAALAAKADDLARSNGELQQFAYVASHDLQAPLRNIVSFSRILTERYAGALDAEGREFLGFVREGAMSMHGLINDLLDLSRVETRGGQFVQCDLNRVLDDAMEVLELELEPTRARVEYSGLPSLQADPLQLQKLFENLISNAVKFQTAGQQPVVRITARMEAHECRIEVLDNGIGIEARHLDQIFVIFRRLHTVDKYPGTGIGLAICRKIIDRHGGRIWVDSEPGRGSRFHIALPATRPEVELTA
jgi:light-regulated signal transduction histidine kinase (bacteriophytochrome)